MSVQKRAERALAGYFDDRPEVLDHDSRAEDLRTVVLETVHERELCAGLEDICGGDGRELAWKDIRGGGRQRPKLHSAYSSCGLALNTFGPWRADPASLVVADRRGFAELRFEREFRIFRRGFAPNLDVALTSPGRVLAIESKLTEHLGKKPAPKFSDAYESLESQVDPTWWAMYRNLKGPAMSFEYLDVAQLVKHYFGLNKYCQANSIHDAALLYLYWEPQDAGQYEALSRHAEEVDRFRAAVSDPVVRFETMTYAELWASWDDLGQPPWLRTHVAELRSRYAVGLP